MKAGTPDQQWQYKTITQVQSKQKNNLIRTKQELAGRRRQILRLRTKKDEIWKLWCLNGTDLSLCSPTGRQEKGKRSPCKLYVAIWELAGTLWFHLSSPSSFSLPLVPAEAPPTPGLTDVLGRDGVILTHGFLFALHRAEEGALHGHEALAHQTLGAAGAPEAVGLGMPVMVAVGNPLGFRLHRLLAWRAFLQSGKTEYSQCKWLNVVFYLRILYCLFKQIINSEVFKDVTVQLERVIKKDFCSAIKCLKFEIRWEINLGTEPQHFIGWPQLTKM